MRILTLERMSTFLIFTPAVVVSLACVGWSVLMALWVVLPPLLFQLGTAVFIATKLWGQPLAAWTSPLLLHAGMAFLSLVLWYGIGEYLLSAKDNLGSAAVIAFSAVYLAGLSAGFFFVWTHFVAAPV